MTPELYSRIVELFEETLTLVPEARLALLARACAGNDELRREVEAMLAADAQSGGCLEKPPDDIAADLVTKGQSQSVVGEHLGDYQVIARLGAGGMGEVFLAEDRRLGRKAALKLLPEEFFGDPVRLRRFQQEACAVSALNHPNIITIYGVGQAGAIHFLATEFIEGRTLSEEVARGPIEVETVVEIAIQSASALIAAHKAGIVHRDIKPENIILRSDGLVKMLDFGLAKRLEQPAGSDVLQGSSAVNTTPGMVVGTPRYMSPEQARGMPVDSRTDLFSLGCVLYELLTGRHAFSGTTPTDVLVAVLTRDPVPLQNLRPDCPAALVRVIDRALDKHRDQRYGSAEELLADLKVTRQSLGPGSSSGTVRFGAFEIDLANAYLLKHGRQSKLQEQPFRILEALLRQPGEIVSREELVCRVWPDGTFVDFEGRLNAAVTRLRQSLGDSAENPRYVETVALEGYRFIGQVESGAAMSPPTNTGRKPPIWILAGAAVLLAAVSTGLWWVRFRLVATPVDQSLTVLPLTTDVGYATSPAFSPDGSQIAYEWDQGRRDPRIFLKLVGPGEPRQLTTGSAEEFSPAWSPDGKFVAFIRGVSESRVAVLLVPALGGAERRIGEFPRGTYYYPQYRPRLLTWTPDSKHLIAVIPNTKGQYSKLFLIRIDTGETMALTESGAAEKYWDRDPAVSPDGKFLVFARESAYGAADLQVVSLTRGWRQSGKLRSITSEISAGRYALTPAWAPDGSEVVYCSNRDASPRLWRISLAPGAIPRQVNSVGPDSSLPAISLRGRLVYAHGHWDSNIWRQELSSRSARLKSPESLIASTAQDSSPQYSPDGLHIAFQSARSGNYEIWICDSDGGNCRQLTYFNGPVTGMPRWSPDGRKIAFDSTAGGNGTIRVFVTDAEGGAPRPVTSGTGNQMIPSWSHDGKWIYFASTETGRSEIWKVPESGGAAIQVTHKGGFVSFESPDGRYLYFTRPPGLLLRSDVDGNAERKIADHMAKRGLAVTANRIFFLGQENDKTPATLRSLELRTGVNTPLAAFSKMLDLGLSISPDLKYVLYTQIDSEGSNLMLVDQFR